MSLFVHPCISSPTRVAGIPQRDASHPVCKVNYKKIDPGNVTYVENRHPDGMSVTKLATETPRSPTTFELG